MDQQPKPQNMQALDLANERRRDRAAQRERIAAHWHHEGRVALANLLDQFAEDPDALAYMLTARTRKVLTWVRQIGPDAAREFLALAGIGGDPTLEALQIRQLRILSAALRHGTESLEVTDLVRPSEAAA